jgi:serine/threonine protein kinase
MLTSEGTNEYVGSPVYMAPEVIGGKKYDFRVDVWGVGIIAYLLISGDTPFGSSNRRETFQKIINQEPSFYGTKWDSVSKHSKDFIGKCLIKDFRKRPFVEELLSHTWVTGN